MNVLKNSRTKIFIAALSLSTIIACNQNETVPSSGTGSSNRAVAVSNGFDDLANMSFVENKPTEEQAKTLNDQLLFQRATQTYLWAMPLLNTLGMKEGSEKAFGAGYNILPAWKKRLNAKTLITTPNSDVLYAMGYIDVGKEGPLVVEAPAMTQSILLDFWQRPIPVDGGQYFGDIGFFGPDKGKGGKFLVLPPGYKGNVPKGYFVYRSGTNNIFVFLRSFYKDPADLTPAASLLEQTKIYPLGKEASAKKMEFPDGSGVAANLLPARDFTAFEQLKRLLDSEDAASLASPDWLGMLATLGIIKGKPFNPDAHTKDILDKAAKTAYKMSRAVALQNTISGESITLYPGTQWVNPLASGTPDNLKGPYADMTWKRKDGGYIDLNARIWFFTDYYSYSPGMISQTPGLGAKYVIAFRGKDSEYLDPSATYKVHLPPNVPAANFWSLTLYESENASGYDNGQPFPSVGSRDKPVQNADGSFDLYVGPAAPEGQAKNWLKTIPGKGYFAILRLYGPTEKAIDNSWAPSDLEKIK